MIHRVLCFLAISSIRTKAFEQHGYNLTSERLEVVEYDKAWFIAKTVNFKYNRTLALANITYILSKNLDYDVELVIESYKFASNEYRGFPMNFKRRVCDTLASNDFGLQIAYACGNFTGCPLRKGQYFICNWAPDGKQFPPYLPSGAYKAQFTLIFHSRQIGILEWYFKVEKKFRYI